MNWLLCFIRGHVAKRLNGTYFVGRGGYRRGIRMAVPYE